MAENLRCVQRGLIDDISVSLYEVSSMEGIYIIGPGPNGMFAKVYSGVGELFSAYMNAKNEGRFNIDPSEIEIEKCEPMDKKLQIDMS